MRDREKFKLLLPSVDFFFGDRGDSYWNSMESTIRYITIKKCKDISKLKDTYFVRYIMYTNGNELQNILNDVEKGEILICYPRNNSTHFPSIEITQCDRIDKDKCFEEKYLQERFVSRCDLYVHKENRNIIAVIGNPKTGNYDDFIYAFQSIIFRLMPWFYDVKANNLDADEIALFKSLQTKDWETYDKLCLDLFRKFDFAEEYLKKNLFGWENTAYRKQLNNAENEVNAKRGLLLRYERDYLDAIEGYSNAMEIYTALLDKNTSDSDTFYEFFKKRPYITIGSVGDGKIRYYVRNTLEYYDEELLERMLNNKRSYLNEDFPEDVVKTIRWIFLEDNAKVAVESYWTMEQTTSLRPNTGRRAKDDDYAPHPHLYGHGCTGGNGTNISTALKKGDWQTAIDQTIAATKNISWGDSTVVRWFINWLLDYKKKKVLILRNGEKASMEECMELANANEVKENG